MTAILEGETLKKAQRRELEKVHARLIGHGISLITFAIFVFFGFSSYLRDFAGGGTTFLSMLAFLALYFVIDTLISFPVSYYYGFMLEKRDEMLKQNLAGWLRDQLKESAIGFAITTVMMLALFSAFRAFPSLWFPVALGIITLFFAAILLLSPTLARMRFKSAPLENPELEARIAKVFQKAGVKLTKVSKWVFAEKVKQGNAALIPDGIGSEVLISDTLMQSIDPEGIEVILAHELGHKVHNDIRKGVILGWFTFVAMISAAYFAMNALTGIGGIQGATDIAAVPILGFVFSIIGEITGLYRNTVIRKAEYAADKYALENTQNFPAFERAFRALAKDNLSDPNPPEWIEFWLHDHPSIEKRLAAARVWAKAG
jgi:STE24 endopeptidase